MRKHRLQSAHVVQAVGQFDEQGAYIIMDRLQHLLVVVHLQRGLVVLFFLLRHHIDQRGHIFAKHFAQFLHRVIRILDYIVQ